MNKTASRLFWTRHHVLTFFFSLSSLIFATGQSDALFFHHLTVADKLTSQDFNFYLFKDAQGFVWISSIFGLNRFDGQDVKQYLSGTDAPHSLADDNIHSAFFEDRDSNLWFTTNSAIHRYVRKHDWFESFKLNVKENGENAEYQLLHLDTLKNELWVRYNNLLFKCPTSNIDGSELIGSYNKLNHICRIIPQKNGPGKYLFVPSRRSLEVYLFLPNQEEQLIFSLPDNAPNGHITSINYESDRKIWLGTRSGLMFINLTNKDYQFHPIDTNHYAYPLEISDLASLNTDTLIVATKNTGIFYYNKKNKQYIKSLYTKEFGQVLPFSYPIYRIYLDRDKTLWISSPGKGVFYTNLQKLKFKTYLQKKAGSSFERSHISALTEDSLGRLWCLTRDGIIVLDQDNQAIDELNQKLQVNAPFLEGEPFYIYADRSNRIWIGMQSGLYLFEESEGIFTKIPVVSESEELGFTFITQLSNGRILASSSSSGIFELSERDGRFLLQPMKEMKDEKGGFFWIYEDALHQVYFQQIAILIISFKMNGQNLERDTSIDFSAQMSGFLQDQDQKKLWVASSEGLYQIQVDQGLQSFHKVDSFPRLSVHGILQDERGSLWLSSNNGLFNYQPIGAKIRKYNLSDGLQSTEFNLSSYAKTPKGTFAFGGVNGLNLFVPEQIQDISTKATPVITQILINDQEPSTDLYCLKTGAKNITQIQYLKLPHDQNTLSFNFAALEYSDPSSNRFYYKMEPIDENWIEADHNFARYAALAPRTYTFLVRATNADEKLSTEVHRLNITIRPPWYNSWEFYLLLTLILIWATYKYYQFRIDRIKKRETDLRKEAEFKQKEAEYQLKVAETETAILRLQMNPHFIFNSLNSISSYILQKDIATANDYLARFSKLIRKILYLAEQPEIELSEEIDFLKQYLLTENIRLENKFTFTIACGDDIDPDDTFIPTMILQPFLENAIWHGIAPKESSGKITIRFEKQGSQLLCSVEDNGVGRAHASKKDRPGHQSKALSITEKRLQILRNRTKLEAGYQIIDLVDDHGQASGTKIILQLPFL